MSARRSNRRRRRGAHPSGSRYAWRHPAAWQSAGRPLRSASRAAAAPAAAGGAGGRSRCAGTRDTRRWPREAQRRAVLGPRARPCHRGTLAGTAVRVTLPCWVVEGASRGRLQRRSRRKPSSSSPTGCGCKRHGGVIGGNSNPAWKRAVQLDRSDAGARKVLMLLARRRLPEFLCARTGAESAPPKLQGVLPHTYRRGQGSPVLCPICNRGVTFCKRSGPRSSFELANCGAARRELFVTGIDIERSARG